MSASRTASFRLTGLADGLGPRRPYAARFAPENRFPVAPPRAEPGRPFSYSFSIEASIRRIEPSEGPSRHLNLYQNLLTSQQQPEVDSSALGGDPSMAALTW
jgi:hypothetical protein